MAERLYAVLDTSSVSRKQIRAPAATEPRRTSWLPLRLAQKPPILFVAYLSGVSPHTTLRKALQHRLSTARFPRFTSKQRKPFPSAALHTGERARTQGWKGRRKSSLGCDASRRGSSPKREAKGSGRGARSGGRLARGPAIPTVCRRSPGAGGAVEQQERRDEERQERGAAGPPQGDAAGRLHGS